MNLETLARIREEGQANAAMRVATGLPGTGAGVSSGADAAQISQTNWHGAPAVASA